MFDLIGRMRAMPQGKLGPALEEMKVLLAADGDFLRRLMQAVQELLEAEITEALRTPKGERTAARLSYRSGYYDRTLVSRDGKLELRVPQDRAGRFSTELVERYRLSEKALVTVDDDCLREPRWLYDRRDLTEAGRDLAAWLAKWQATYPKLCSWVEEHIEETLTFYRLRRQHHKHLKSTNLLERLNEVDQAAHPRGAHLPQRPRACLRLVQALAVEMHENWLEAHRHPKMGDLREHKKVLRTASGGLCHPNVLAYFE
jgi:putative transposase